MATPGEVRDFWVWIMAHGGQVQLQEIHERYAEKADDLLSYPDNNVYLKRIGDGDDVVIEMTPIGWEHVRSLP